MDLGMRRSDGYRMALVYAAISAAALLSLFGVGAWAGSYKLLGAMSVVAFVFGLRHGLDADHIAAIDNTTRRMLQRRRERPPTMVGTWFSLGHSTVVFGLTFVFVLAGKAVSSSFPALQAAGGVMGTTISGAFLCVIGAMNVVVILQVYRAFRSLRSGGNKAEAREGGPSPGGLDQVLGGGLVTRLFGRVFRMVEEPWQMYPVGFLFGLGFDTATEVGLIVISLTVSTSAPIWTTLLLPLMFTCGMVLVDTTDNVLMVAAYSWAFLRPVRRAYYNLTVTVISVMIAFGVGGIELVQVLSNELNLRGGIWAGIAGVDFETLGIGLVGAVTVFWVASMAVYKLKGLDDSQLPLAVPS